MQSPAICVYSRLRIWQKIFICGLCHFYHAGGFYREMQQEFLVLLYSFLLRCVDLDFDLNVYLSDSFAVSQHPLCPFKFCDGKSRKYPALQSVAPADEDLRERAC